MVFKELDIREELEIGQVKMASLVTQRVKRLPTMWETRVRSLGQEDPLEKEITTHSSILDFPGGSDSKTSVYNAGDLGSIPALGQWRRKQQSTPVLLPRKSHGQRSLVGYSPWGHKELDTTEQLHLHFSLSCIGE